MGISNYEDEAPEGPVGWIDGARYQRVSSSNLRFAKKLKAIREIVKRWGSEELCDNEAMGMIDEVITDVVSADESLSIWKSE